MMLRWLSFLVILSWTAVKGFIPRSTMQFEVVSMRHPVRCRTIVTNRVIANSDSENTEDYKIKDPKFIERAKRWVVIVDDEEAIRMAVGDFLYDQGYQVTACADADALLEVCAKPKVDGKLPAIPDAIIRSVDDEIFFF
jgi:PleD family two-component response regulator